MGERLSGGRKIHLCHLRIRMPVCVCGVCGICGMCVHAPVCVYVRGVCGVCACSCACVWFTWHVWSVCVHAHMCACVVCVWCMWCACPCLCVYVCLWYMWHVTTCVCVCACMYLWPWFSSGHLAIPVTVPRSFNYCSFRSVQRSFSFVAKSLFFTLFHSCLNHSLKFLLNLIGFHLILLYLSLHFPKLYFTALYYCDFLALYRLFYSSAHCQIMLVPLRANDHNVIML